MKILAFMQNTWARDAERVQVMLDRAKERRNRHEIVARLLFSSDCRSARILRQHLSVEHVHRMIWEEASPVVTAGSAKCPPCDVEHMAAVLKQFTPDLVICFGHLARNGMMLLALGDRPNCEVLLSRHPASRHPKVAQDLAKIRARLDAAWPEEIETLHETFSR